MNNVSGGGASVRRALLALSVLVSLSACTDPAAPVVSRLTLSFAKLEALANGFHYEGWAVLPGGPVSTGKFNINSSGALVTLAGALITNGEFAPSIDISGATAIVITIEPAGDVDAVPSNSKLLGGTVASGSASLAISAPQAIGSTFATATGKYTLATPTDGMNNNETSGLWFLELVNGAPIASLVLPALPAGWIYEGWAVINGKPVTTGKFSAVSGADASKPYSGPQAAPPFPGEDFLLNAPAGLVFPTNLSGGTAVVTVEPVPDDSPAPFTLKPLLSAIPANALDHVAYLMGLNAASFPTGTAVIRK